MLVYGHGDHEPGNLINSRESFEMLSGCGADGVELDVRMCRDGGLVVIHDHKFHDGRPVAETASADRPEDVLLLGEALDLCRGLVVNIEIKNYPSDPAFDPDERVTKLVVELLGQRGDVDTVLLSSFGIGCMNRASQLAPAVETALLLLSRRPAEEILRPAVDHGHSLVHPYATMIDKHFMDVASENGLAVNAWTGFDETEATIDDLIRLGVAGVITAYPVRALEIVRKKT